MYSSKQAADKLNVSVRRVNALIHSGELRAQKIGNSWAIDEQSVEERLQRPRLLGRPKGGEKDTRNLESYTLMNRNHEVLDFTYNKRQGTVLDIDKRKDIDWMPLGIGVQGSKLDRYNLGTWIEHRYIPSIRPNLHYVLQEAELSDAADLMFASWGLNLSDQYWFRPQGVETNWHDINYFENGFSDSLGMTLLGLDGGSSFDLHTPDSATPGVLPKKWEQKGDKFYLIKGSSTHESREPYNELLASRLLGRLLDVDEYVPYELIHRGEKVFSSCPTMVSSETEFIAAAEICVHYSISEGRNLFESYLEAGSALGIPSVSEAIDKMIVCDYLMANFDRHLHNFGIVRKVETLDEYRIAPLFDNGAGFFSRATITELEARRFTWHAHPFKIYPSQQLALVGSLAWYDAGKLDGFLDEVVEVLSGNENISPRFIDASVKQLTRLIETVNDVYLERHPLFSGF